MYVIKFGTITVSMLKYVYPDVSETIKSILGMTMRRRYVCIYAIMHNVTCTTTTGQRLGKSVPASHAHTAIEHSLLGNGPISTPHFQYRLCFPWGPCHVVIKEQRKSLEEERTEVEIS